MEKVSLKREGKKEGRMEKCQLALVPTLLDVEIHL